MKKLTVFNMTTFPFTKGSFFMGIGEHEGKEKKIFSGFGPHQFWSIYDPIFTVELDLLSINVSLTQENSCVFFETSMLVGRRSLFENKHNLLMAPVVSSWSCLASPHIKRALLPFDLAGGGVQVTHGGYGVPSTHATANDKTCSSRRLSSTYHDHIAIPLYTASTQNSLHFKRHIL